MIAPRYSVRVSMGDDWTWVIIRVQSTLADAVHAMELDGFFVHACVPLPPAPNPEETLPHVH